MTEQHLEQADAAAIEETNADAPSYVVDGMADRGHHHGEQSIRPHALQQHERFQQVYADGNTNVFSRAVSAVE